MGDGVPPWGLETPPEPPLDYMIGADDAYFSNIR